MPFAELSSVRLHFYDHGEGDRVVVLVHGFQASGRIWQLVWDRMPADRYRCIAVDNRGAGQSEAPVDSAAYGAKPFADDLHELLGQLGLRDVVLVGHSMGGLTAMQYAVDHPDMLYALVLVDPADPDGIAPEVVDIEAAIESRLSGRQAIRTASIAGEAREHVPSDFLDALSAEIAAAPEQRLRGSFRSMLTTRIGAQVSALRVPVLLLAGDIDQTVPLPRILGTYAKLPAGSGLHVWHGVGHSPNVEVADRMTRVMRRFIEKTVPERQSSPAGERDR